MNFKEIYTEANDEIVGNREVLNKILSRNAPKQRISFKLVVPAVAVCMAVVAVVAVNPFKHSLPGNVTPETNIIMATPKTDNPIVRSVEPDVEVRMAAEEPVVSTQEIIPQTQYVVTPEVAEALEVAEVPADEPIAVENTGSELNINYNQTLFGPDASVMTRGISETVTMTPEEYAEYIGKDIAGVLDIPDDLAVLVPEFIEAEIDENGNITSEKATFYAHSEDFERFAEVNVSKTKNITIPSENLEVSDICGNEAVIISDGTDYNASFVCDGVQYFVRTGGITEEELKNLLISLNGGKNNDKEDFSSSNDSDDSSIISGNDGSIG